MKKLHQEAALKLSFSEKLLWVTLYETAVQDSGEEIWIPRM